MNQPNQSSQRERGGLAYLAATLGALLIVLVLIWAMKHFTEPAPLAAGRPAERAKALMELRAADQDALATVGWIDQGKGLVRLPIKDAMDLAGRLWQNPSSARSNLIARVEKATYVPPPPPSQFE